MAERQKVYLCGTITPDDKHLDWRKEAEEFLRIEGIGVLSPVRGKDPEDWTKDGLEGKARTTYARGGFVERDEMDMADCRAVLLRFMADARPDRQSIGTWAEYGLCALAGGLGRPVVVVTDMPEVRARGPRPPVHLSQGRPCGGNTAGRPGISGVSSEGGRYSWADVNSPNET